MALPVCSLPFPGYGGRIWPLAPDPCRIASLKVGKQSSKGKAKYREHAPPGLAVTGSATCPGDTPAAAASTVLAFSKPPSAAGLTKSRRSSLLPADPWVPQPGGFCVPWRSMACQLAWHNQCPGQSAGVQEPRRTMGGNRSPLAFSLAQCDYKGLWDSIKFCFPPSNSGSPSSLL